MAHKLLVVDVQPEFSFVADYVVKAVAAQINRARSTVICWVGQGMSDDTEEDVRHYLRKHGATKQALNNAIFVEKDYGWLRGWMDYGVDDEDIITVLSDMRAKNRHDTLDYTRNDLEDLLGHSRFPHDDPLHSKGAFDPTPLLQHSEWQICGGGTDECLHEMELWLNANGKQTERLDSCIY